MGSSCVNLSRDLAAPRRRASPSPAAITGEAWSHCRRRRRGGAPMAACRAASRTGTWVVYQVAHGRLPCRCTARVPGPVRHRHRHLLITPTASGSGSSLGARTSSSPVELASWQKILRTNPDVGKIYVLIKAKDAEAALQRLQTEGGQHRHCPPSWPMRSLNGVDIIVNSAANTTFDERYDVAMDINTVGPFRIMSFAHRFRRLKLFLQVSTAYVNGQRQGVVLEKPFRLGDTIGKESGSSDSSDQHKNAVLDIEAEIKLAFDSRRHSDDSASFSQEMKDLGLERAKLHGWQDTYVFTKAMGEMVINSMRGEIPVVTIRPSVIESTWRDPFQGWMEGNRMMDPVVLYYGKGQLSGFLADPDGVLDVVPADMVVNATLASMAKHGRPAAAGSGGGMHVYHVASSTVNPLVFGDLSRFLFQHFTRSPYSDAAGQPIAVPPMRLFDTMEQFASYVEADTLLRTARAGAASAGERLSQRFQELCAKSIEQTIHLGSIYQPYTFYTGRFDNGNTEGLIAEMSAEEKAAFHFDVRSIDWTDYITNVHIPGLRKHVMKGRGVTASASATASLPSSAAVLAGATTTA
ncbi:hypothetical protein ACQ4PT_053474 [Festuca glaucescens]